MIQKRKLKAQLFSYMGSKQKHIKIINKFIHASSKEVYVEPFLGSGAVLLNLEREFKEYHIAEKYKSILNIFKWIIREKNYFEKFEKFYLKNYNIKNYDEFYKFREYYNTHLLNSNIIEESFAIIMLAGHCLNRMFRENYNTKNFNASFGNRPLNQIHLNYIKVSCQKIYSIKNKLNFYNDYKECINIKNSIQFIDPPYFKRSAGYATNWGEKDTIELLNKISLNNDVIYTDLYHDHANKKFKNKYSMGLLRSISPSFRNNVKNEEFLYTNIGV
jgi:site-specific DNA-adenine methylase